jgi:putative transposase
MWNLPAPPGFQGLHPDKPLTIYYRHLPHWRQEGATYFLTFRQSDSLPQDKLRQLEMMRREWERRNPPPQTEEQLTQLARTTTSRV